jgi:hypothetical protein
MGLDVAIHFDDLQIIRRVRARDPVTSVDAAEKTTRFAWSHAQRIRSALGLHGAMTAHEIGAKTGLTVVQIDRRLPELAAAGEAFVVQVNGRDLERDGFRVWSAANKSLYEN